MVALLLADLRVEVSQPDTDGFTPFYVACYDGHKEVVLLLLASSRVDVNKSNNNGSTPFFVACQNGHQEVVSLLLADTRVDLNKPNNNLCTPLWTASINGHLPVVRLILTSGREVDTQTKSIAGDAPWNDKTAAEHARFQETRARADGEDEEVHARMKKNGPLIADLLDTFDADTAFIRQQLRELPELRDPFISDHFALVVFLCDGFLTLGAGSSVTDKKAARFFQIACSLPMELQMLLCNRVFGAGKNSVLTKHSEPAFKKLGRMLASLDSR